MAKDLLFIFLNLSVIQRWRTPIASRLTGEATAWSKLSLLRTPQKMSTNLCCQREAARQTSTLAPRILVGRIWLSQGVSTHVPVC